MLLQKKKSEMCDDLQLDMVVHPVDRSTRNAEFGCKSNHTILFVLEVACLLHQFLQKLT